MNTRPVLPARIDFDRPGAPFAPDFDDIYHPRGSAYGQARHVFVAGCELPERWRGRPRFAILETGFGLGHNFLAAWDAWRRDTARCERLHVVSIERHPPRHADLQRAHAQSPLPELAAALLDRWPAPTANLHRLAFDAERVELLLLYADVGDAMRAIVGRFDAFFLDGFAPSRNPAMWSASVLRHVGRLAAPGAIAATWSVARSVHDGLSAAGFDVRRAAGFGDRREMTVAHFCPRHVPAEPPGRATAVAARDAIVVGGGLAGCACAAALAGEGVQVQLIDRGPVPAGGASGQPAAIFHGTVHRADGVHARFTRAAALIAGTTMRDAVQRANIDGSIDGLLRLARDPSALDEMRATVDAQALPAAYVDVLDAAAASGRAGVRLDAAAWFYPGGGWVDPAALAASWLQRDGIRTRWGSGVAALRRGDGGAWQLLGDDGRIVAEGDVVVLAGGADGAAMLDACRPRDTTRPLLANVRGQTTIVAAGTRGLVAPRLPLADAGYALTLCDGRVLVGASSERADDDASPRGADRLANLSRLERLTGSRIDPAATGLACRTGVRLVSADRLPLVGAMPALCLPADGRRLDQPRLVPREAGLYACSAFGSRGLTWAPLAARLLAARIVGAPWPVEADLADAVDPARFISRAVRSSGS